MLDILCYKQEYSLARFQVLTAASMKMAVFWDVAPSSLVEVYRRFRGDHRSDVGAARPSDTLPATTIK
jgi:hypothetical protein